MYFLRKCVFWGVEKDKKHCKGRNFRKFLLFGPKNCQKGSGPAGRPGVGGGEGTAGKGAESTMNLDLSEEESALAALTESKFRQGLEASLDLPTTDND